MFPVPGKAVARVVCRLQAVGRSGRSAEPALTLTVATDVGAPCHLIGKKGTVVGVPAAIQTPHLRGEVGGGVHLVLLL